MTIHLSQSKNTNKKPNWHYLLLNINGISKIKYLLSFILIFCGSRSKLTHIQLLLKIR